MNAVSFNDHVHFLFAKSATEFYSPSERVSKLKRKLTSFHRLQFRCFSPFALAKIEN